MKQVGLCQGSKNSAKKVAVEDLAEKALEKVEKMIADQSEVRQVVEQVGNGVGCPS